jgi:hypothetical protein
MMGLVNVCDEKEQEGDEKRNGHGKRKGHEIV